MNNSDPENLETKYTVADTAARFYVENDGSFTLKQIAGETGLSVADLLGLFTGKQEILEFYYESIVIRYLLMSQEIDGFDRLLLAEKISNFVYTSFDIMSERQAFVEMSYDNLILCSRSGTGFKQRVKRLFNDFVGQDNRISSAGSLLSTDLFYSVLEKKYLYLVRFWLHDKSEDKELTMELTDKYTTFLQELMYSKAADKGFDLAKFMFANNIFRPDFRFLKDLFPTIEIRD